MTKPARQPETADAREALLAASGRLFSERSYAAVGVREIADAAGVNLGLIQYHFGSKGALFVEAVRRMMGHCAGNAAVAALAPRRDTAAEAAYDVALFIRLLLDCLLRPRSPEGCRMMMREVLDDAGCPEDVRRSLVTIVAEDVTGPLIAKLMDHLRVLAPKATPQELEAAANGIVGHCSHYLANRPFLEHLRGEPLNEPRVLDEIAASIARFAFRGLRCDERVIVRAVRRAGAKDLDAVREAIADVRGSR